MRGEGHSKSVSKNDYSVKKQLSVTAQALYRYQKTATEGAEVTR